MSHPNRQPEQNLPDSERPSDIAPTQHTDDENSTRPTEFSDRPVGADDDLTSRGQGEAELRRRVRILRTLLAATTVIALIGAIAAAVGFVQAANAKRLADTRTREAVALRLTAQGQDMLAGVRAGGDVRAIQQIRRRPLEESPNSEDEAPDSPTMRRSGHRSCRHRYGSGRERGPVS